MNKIIRINMNSLEAVEEQVPEVYRGLGGRGLTSVMIDREVQATCHPLGRNNKLIFAPGLLAGTACPNSGRISVGAKSPLTGTIKESNAGGTAAQKLARLGIAALVVEGLPKDNSLYVVKLSAEGVEIAADNTLAGLGNYDTVARMTERFGSRVSLVTIGQAGEMKLEAASIAVTDRENRPTRHCARGGLGAVMGSKRVKAIVIDDSGATRVSAADRERFQKNARAFTKALMAHPVTGQGLPTYGSNILTNLINESGGLPTRNFSEGRFEGAQKVSGETGHDNVESRGGVVSHGCMPGCVIKCSSIYNDKNGQYISKGPEYETVWAHGPNCGIDDLDAIAMMDRMEDDFGVDTIEIGTTIAIAMEAGIIQFGDTQGAMRLVGEIGKGTAVGRIIGSGAAIAGRILGVEHVPVVKGQALPAYDPRAIQGIGVTYATTTMGADHTAGYCIASNILGCGGKVDPLRPEGQAELSRNLQIATAAIDTFGLCLFVAFCLLDSPEALQAVCDMVSAHYGDDFTADDMTALGMKVLKTEREFNKRAGFTKEDDRLPEFLLSDTVAPHNTTFMVPDEELDWVLDF